MQAAADAVIAATPRLAADASSPASIPGVGTQTASTVLAELPAIDRVPSGQSAADDCGLFPREFRSGSCVRGRTRLSKSGNARLRTALDLPTLTAIRFSVSPTARHLGLYFATLPDGYFTAGQVVQFLRELLKHLRGKVIVAWDRGPNHKGPAVREFLRRHRRLRLEMLLPYTPPS